MKTSKLMIAAFIAGGISMFTASCETACPDMTDPSYNDSIWSNPYDSTGTCGTNDSTIFTPDTTGTGGWGTPGDSTVFGGGWGDSTYYGGDTDTTGWGDSTFFGG
jgi:hypothetical protein